MSKIYGYCRISTDKQNIERQERNIRSKYPNAIIVKEIYTGTKFQGRLELEKILNAINPGDTIVFDSVSRMSRDADQGFELYEKLYNQNINLIFLKESYINTDVYKKALTNKVDLVGDKVDLILDGINKYLLEVAKEQIKYAFEQSEKEVSDLRQRTKEGIETARLNGKQIGQKKGVKLNIKKKEPTKQKIIKYSKHFNGSLNDKECIQLIGIARNTFYKYKKELLSE
ncbi:recombinase family protein [Lachnospira multipara]|uniref:Site-specific DNA recombinase n=1 Tax=Lachnospira multipara TaxID=28051 RepID=A0A1H5VWF8_9FIRM|nr:recombinase family protein [Lachnospira multipara]SEF91316.1 Site-specific DNA recombinase [Lachnospira multipara]